MFKKVEGRANYVIYEGKKRVENVVKVQDYMDFYRDPSDPTVSFRAIVIEPALLSDGPNGQSMESLTRP